MKKKKKSIKKLYMRQNIFIWAVLIPAIILYLMFAYLPFGNTIVGSFFDWNALSGNMEFIGLDNYKELMNDRILGKSIINTFYFTGVSITIKTILALIIALWVSSVKKFQSLYRTSFFLPAICSMLATSFVFRFLFQPDLGTINGYLHILGIKGLGWLQDPKTAMPTVILFTIWKTMGYVFLIFLAGIKGISSEVLEAAEVDGASGFKKTWLVILPLLKPVIAFNIATQMIGALQAYTSIYGLTFSPQGAVPGGPMYSTTTTLIRIYQVAFKDYRFGYGSAMSLVLFVIIMVFTLIQLRFIFRDEEI